MNKADKILIGFIVLCAILFYVPLFYYDIHNQGKPKEVVVSLKNEEILREDMNEDKDYQVEGTLGPVDIEVKGGAVRVEKENSPYHLCSIQGWVEEANRPIICLPNNIVVQIESVDNEAEVDTVIQ